MKITHDDKAVVVSIVTGAVSAGVALAIIVALGRLNVPDFVLGSAVLATLAMMVAFWSVLATSLLARLGLMCERCRTLNLNRALQRIAAGQACVCSSER